MFLFLHEVLIALCFVIQLYLCSITQKEQSLKILRSANKVLHAAAVSEVNNDTIPWFGILYRRQELKANRVLKNAILVHEKLYKETEAEYVPGNIPV